MAKRKTVPLSSETTSVRTSRLDEPFTTRATGRENVSGPFTMTKTTVRKVGSVLVKKPASKPAPKPARLLASDVFKSESPYFNGADVQAIGAFDAQIGSITQEAMPDGAKKWVLRLEGRDKAIVVNKTNGLRLADNLGDVMDTWPGLWVHVYVEKTRNPNNGQIGPGICLRGVAAPEDSNVDEEVDEPFDEEDEEDSDDET